MTSGPGQLANQPHAGRSSWPHRSFDQTGLQVGVDAGLVAKNPAIKLRAPAPVRSENIIPFESWEEVEKVAAACGRWAPIVMLMADTGARPGEVQGVQHTRLHDSIGQSISPSVASQPSNLSHAPSLRRASPSGWPADQLAVLHGSGMAAGAERPPRLPHRRVYCLRHTSHPAACGQASRLAPLRPHRWEAPRRCPVGASHPAGETKIAPLLSRSQVGWLTKSICSARPGRVRSPAVCGLHAATQTRRCRRAVLGTWTKTTSDTEVGS
jgi:hypothetical protein